MLEDVVAQAHRFGFVIGAKRHAAGRPAQHANRALRDQRLDLLVVRPQHFAR
jgi:hypothetical protein